MSVCDQLFCITFLSTIPFSDIKARQEAVTELSEKTSPFVNKLCEVLKKLPDVDRSLTRILHGKVHILLKIVVYILIQGVLV